MARLAFRTHVPSSQRVSLAQRQSRRPARHAPPTASDHPAGRPSASVPARRVCKIDQTTGTDEAYPKNGVTGTTAAHGTGMRPETLRTLLEQVRNGALAVETAQTQLATSMRQAPFEDVGFARVDHHRAIRQGFPEVVFGEGKTPDQVAQIAARIVEAGHSLLVTRTDTDAFAAVRDRVGGAVFHETARIISHTTDKHPTGHGTMLVVSGGTSDQRVSEEAVVTGEIMGNCVERLYDVGVAGLHRLLAERSRLEQARVIVVVAGMEGALPSVVGGLVSVPVIAVPTSVGYGASFGGLAALLSMLNSCATGVAVVNIDNGFGAAALASIINHLGQ